MYNILTDPLIRMNASNGSRVEASLPEVYAALMADAVDAFPALRPHQRHAWHAFLVQLGTMAMHKADVSVPPADAPTWADLINGLTPDFPDDEPWQLVVEDITKPAFMQPPASSADKKDEYKDKIETPDELDMLVTAKNHDLKTSLAKLGQMDDWIFSLITLQTTDGNPGRNPGVARMNGAYGNRPAFSITPSTRPGIHVRRDIETLIEYREELLNTYPTHAGDIGVVWTKPWDGQGAESLSLSDLDPLFIEVCRRIRLCTGLSGTLYTIKSTAKAARIEAKALNGRTGDPWTPINRKEGKSLTLSAAGFTYKRTADYLLSSDWQPSPLLLKMTDYERRTPKTMLLVARGMVRGQGKTEGYHERIILFREKVVGVFGRSPRLKELGDIARERIEQIRTIQRILRRAVWTFAVGGKTDGVGDEQRARANSWADKLDEIVDISFFDALQDEFAEDDMDKRELIRNEWLLSVVNDARSLLRQAQDSLPCPAIQQYRARVRADSEFEGRIRGNKGLPFLFTEKGDNDDDQHTRA